METLEPGKHQDQSVGPREIQANQDDKAMLEICQRAVDEALTPEATAKGLAYLRQCHQSGSE